MPTDTDAPFQLRSLVERGGVAGNAEKLTNLLSQQYPAELRAASLKRENQDLREQVTSDDGLGKVRRIIGAPDGDHVRATVRGGHQDDGGDPVVSYVHVDANGDTWKGCFPLFDLGSASSKGHVSQRDSLANTPEAKQHAEAQQMRARAQRQSSGDFIADYEEMRADEITSYLDEHPDRADTVKALERASRGKDARKSVMEWKAREPDSGAEDASGSS
jgi:hypothetical protein